MAPGSDTQLRLLHIESWRMGAGWWQEVAEEQRGEEEEEAEEEKKGQDTRHQ